MKIAFLAADDPLYLPAFFDRVLGVVAPETAGVFATPPLYRRQTSLGAAWRYLRSFGLRATFQLSRRVLAARIRSQSIASVCRQRGVAYEVVPDVNAPDFLGALRRAEVDVIVSVSCPQIFRRPLIELPSRGLLNIHGAILPQYRGVMPGFWMLANGERKAGVTVYFVNDDLDAGDVCAQQTFDILPRESLDAFLRRSKWNAAELLLTVLERLEKGELTRTPLDISKGSYFSWPGREAVRRFRAGGRRVW